MSAVSITLRVGKLKPFILRGETKMPRYTRKVVAAMLKEQFKEHGMSP